MASSGVLHGSAGKLKFSLIRRQRPCPTYLAPKKKPALWGAGLAYLSEYVPQT
jgi:hypothetical protein